MTLRSFISSRFNRDLRPRVNFVRVDLVQSPFRQVILLVAKPLYKLLLLKNQTK
jgi:hypothetical protein